MNPDLDKLKPYPFERLARLKDGIVPPGGLDHIALSIGEPKHAAPQFVIDALVRNMATTKAEKADKAKAVTVLVRRGEWVNYVVIRPGR